MMSELDIFGSEGAANSLSSCSDDDASGPESHEENPPKKSNDSSTPQVQRPVTRHSTAAALKNTIPSCPPPPPPVTSSRQAPGEPKPRLQPSGFAGIAAIKGVGPGGVISTVKTEPQTSMRKRRRRPDPRSMTDEQRIERRERNREHAKRSRIRKKFLLESLQVYEYNHPSVHLSLSTGFIC
jgi:hypothetical protein